MQNYICLPSNSLPKATVSSICIVVKEVFHLFTFVYEVHDIWKSLRNGLFNGEITLSNSTVIEAIKCVCVS